MPQLIIGKYIPGQSLIHRLDPRVKLLLVFSYVFVVFLAHNAVAYALLLLYVAIPFVVSRISLRFLLAGLKPILWLFLFTFLLQLFTVKEGQQLLHWGWFSVYEKGLEQGFFISIRFVVIVVMTTMLTLTTTPIEITDGMEALLQPFKKIGLPVHEIALMMSISLRFIPTLMEETEKIMKAQAARGTDFAGGPLRERLKAVIALLVPLFISAFKRAEDLAIAMEARGYRGGEGRTKFRELRWQMKDTWAVCSLLVLTICLIWIRW